MHLIGKRLRHRQNSNKWSRLTLPNGKNLGSLTVAIAFPVWPQQVSLGASLTQAEVDSMLSLLQDFINVFA